MNMLGIGKIDDLHKEYEPEGGYDEWDETYLERFQRLYDIDRLPWPTKTVLVLRRTK